VTLTNSARQYIVPQVTADMKHARTCQYIEAGNGLVFFFLWDKLIYSLL